MLAAAGSAFADGVLVLNSDDVNYSIVSRSQRIETVLALQDVPDESCQRVCRMASDQLQAVESRIRRLRTELVRMIKECDNGKVATCRIIEALADSPRPSEPPTTPPKTAKHHDTRLPR